MYLDKKDSTYKTESMFDINDGVAVDDEGNIPRDLLLSLVFELDALAKELKEKSSVDDEEMKEFLEQRKLVGEGTFSPASVDINKIFPDDEETDSDM